MNRKGEETFRVLFIGAMDVISTHFADRLRQEGSRICWLTPQQKTFPHRDREEKIYRQALSRESIRRVLKLHNIDTVVFHCDPGRETDGETYADWGYVSALRALRALLDILREHELKHFILISTAELANAGNTPRMAEMRFAESLVRYYAKTQELPALILRLGMVYGAGSPGEMGYIGRLIETAEEDRTMEVPYQEDSLVDAVYAGDAAMAAYMLLLCGSRGTFYVLTGKPVTLGELHRTVGGILGKTPRVAYLGQEALLTEDQFAKLSMPLRQETGWMPLYLFNGRGQEALREVVQAAAEGLRKRAEEAKKPAKHSLLDRFRGKSTLRGVLEVLIMFLIVQLLLPYIHDSADLRFVDIRLLFVMLSAIRYGVGLGLLAVGLASLSYIWTLRGMGIDMSYLLYSVDTWIPFIVYGVCGASIGYVADRRSDMLDEAGKRYELLNNRYQFLFSLHKEVLEAKNRLQQQLSGSRESFGKAYEVTERLSSLSPDKVLYESVDVFSEMMENCQAAIWLFDQESSFARLKACTGGIRDALPRTLAMGSLPRLTEGFDADGLFINRDMDPDYPDMAAPIRRKNQVIAFVSLYRVKPSNYTLYYQNLFRVFVGLTENSLGRALQYEEKLHNEYCIAGTELLAAPELSSRLTVARQESEKAHIALLVLEVRRDPDMPLTALSDRLYHLMRASDFAGVDDSGRVLAVLHNALEEDYEPIRRRFASAGVEVVQCRTY